MSVAIRRKRFGRLGLLNFTKCYGEPSCMIVQIGRGMLILGVRAEGESLRLLDSGKAIKIRRAKDVDSAP